MSDQVIKIEVKKSALEVGMDKVSGSVGDQIPALKNVLVRIKGGTMTLVTSDMEITSLAVVPLYTVYQGEELAFITEFSSLNMIAQKAAADLFIFEIPALGDNFSLNLNCGTSVWNVMCQSEKKYPSVDVSCANDPVKLNCEELLSWLRSCKVVMGSEEERPELFGVKFSPENIQAGDGKRFCKIDAATSLDITFSPTSLSVMIKMLTLTGEESCSIATDENGVSFSVGNDCMKTRLLDTKFVPLESLLFKPVDDIKKPLLKVDKVLFEGALDQAQIFSRDQDHAVILKRDGSRLGVTSADQVGNKADIKIPVTWVTEDKNYEALFNWKYLSDLLKILNAQSVVVESGKLSGSKDFVSAKEGNLTGVVLPLLKTSVEETK